MIFTWIIANVMRKIAWCHIASIMNKSFTNLQPLEGGDFIDIKTSLNKKRKVLEALLR